MMIEHCVIADVNKIAIPVHTVLVHVSQSTKNSKFLLHCTYAVLSSVF